MSARPATGASPRHFAAKGKRFERTVVIEASPRRIWEKLENFSQWADWSPLYARSEGLLKLGAPLDMAISLEGMKPIRAKATVVSLEPERLIEYETTPLGGLMRAIRYIEIRPESAGRCTLVNGEVLGGPLAFLSPGKMGERVLKAMGEMNEALKARAEGSG